MPLYPFWGEGSPTREKGSLILTSLLEDLGHVSSPVDHKTGQAQVE